MLFEVSEKTNKNYFFHGHCFQDPIMNFHLPSDLFITLTSMFKSFKKWKLVFLTDTNNLKNFKICSEEENSTDFSMIKG